MAEPKMHPLLADAHPRSELDPMFSEMPSDGITVQPLQVRSQFDAHELGAGSTSEAGANG